MNPSEPTHSSSRTLVQSAWIAAPLNSEISPRLQWLEVSSQFQIPGLQIVGLPAPEVAEAKERVRTAIEASGFDFPSRRVLVNLSPACVRKTGTGIDLAMALAILAVAQHQEAPKLRVVACGELALSGNVQPKGQLTRALFAAWKESCDAFFFSAQETAEVLRARHEIHECRVDLSTHQKKHWKEPLLFPVAHLAEAWRAIRELETGEITKALNPVKLGQSSPEVSGAQTTENASDRNGETSSLLPLSAAHERLLGVCLTGHHHLLWVGPKGTGKTQLLRWAEELAPAPSKEVRLQNLLFSELKSTHLLDRAERAERSNRAKHAKRAIVRKVGTQVRPAALLGSYHSESWKPGEFSLAHGGLLLADEWPEWPRDSRESLREPLESGTVLLTRARQSVELPARFQLMATGNPCACGGWPPEIPVPEGAGSKLQRCRCKPIDRQRYLQRFCGPVLDRFDAAAWVSLSPAQKSDQESSAAVTPEKVQSLRSRIEHLREEASRRWGMPPGLIPVDTLEQMLRSSGSVHAALQSSMNFRSRHRIYRLALSLSLWDGSPEVTLAQVREAQLLRPDRVLGLDG